MRERKVIAPLKGLEGIGLTKKTMNEGREL